MSHPLHPGYRFTTEAQWQACLFAGADRTTVQSRRGLRPFAPYAVPPALFETLGAYAPVLTDLGEALWRDDAGRLQRLPYGEEAPQGSAAPSGIGSASRMVARPGALWAVDRGGSLRAYDIDGLSCLFSVDLGGLEALDIAGDGRDGVFALLASGSRRRIVHLDCAGQADGADMAVEPENASALAYLGQSARLVLLGSGGAKLHWVDPETGHLKRTVLVSALRPCFDVIALGGDGCARLFLAGTDGKAAGGGHQVLTIDAEGNALGAVPLGAVPTGVVASRSQLFVTTAAGLARFDPASSVPETGGEVRTAALTPLLRSPSQTPQRWQRIEARVVLPPGCTIEIAFAGADDDAELLARAQALLDDRSLSPEQRLDNWRRAFAPRTFVFHGDPQAGLGEETILSAPLHDVRESLLWVHVTLTAAPGGQMPVLSELSVLYPGPSLIDQLPAIYRRGELEAGDFIRALVGVLEAGTQQLDARIGDLGRTIHPATASAEWLDYVAGWLGLPWEGSMSLGQKRRIVGSAASIAGGYGTRAGLEALLDSLLPEQPRRFRIVDGTAEFGIALIGGAGCEGSRLPSILSGLPSSATELGNKAVLGRARLPCGEPEPETARLLGRIRIDIAASAEERRAWESWLGALVGSMLPASARAELRWLAWGALSPAGELSKGLTLEGEPQARLGTDSVTGAVRLGGRRQTVLPRPLSDDSTLH
jgi:phage tail-like protein